MYRSFSAALIIALRMTPAAAGSLDLSGDVALELRGFFQSPRLPEQGDASVSLAFNPEFYAAWNDSADSVLLVPFVRLDQNDRRRSHADIRELTYVHAANAWELRIGARRVFWGVAESNHLVDIINQTDAIEDPDGEDKFGQPMVNLALKQPWGTLDFFVLTGFHERSFAGREGRLQAPLPVDVDHPHFEAAARDKHVDYALR